MDKETSHCNAMDNLDLVVNLTYHMQAICVDFFLDRNRGRNNILEDEFPRGGGGEGQDQTNIVSTLIERQENM